MISISKDTLRKLNAAIGKLDADTGRVFCGFIGRLNMSDGLYHGDMQYSDPGDDPPKQTVSIEAILSPGTVHQFNYNGGMTDGNAQD